jgi:hypothetical protein
MIGLFDDGLTTTSLGWPVSPRVASTVSASIRHPLGRLGYALLLERPVVTALGSTEQPEV